MKNKKESKTLKLILMIVFIITILVALGLLAIGIWALVDRYNVATIMGINQFAVAIVLVFISGVLLLATAIIGCCGTLRERQMCVGISAVMFSVIFVLLLAAGIMSFVFKDEIGITAQKHMRQSLITEYGVVDETTRAWDWVQKQIKCCGVSGNSTDAWGIYRSGQSKWFRYYNGPDFNHIYVPESCCRRVNRQYVNQERCQTYTDGPPGCHTCDKVFNDALYYNGCYNVGLEAAADQGVILGAVALVVVLVVLLGALFSFVLCRRISDQI